MKRTNTQRVFFWNRRPGVFVNKQSGQQIRLEGLSIGPMFTGSVKEWYETLVETLIDLKNHLEKDAGCKADTVNVTVDPDVYCILQASVLFHPDRDDTHRGTIGSTPLRIFEDREQERFVLTVDVEYKLGGRTQSQTGRIHILED